MKAQVGKPKAIDGKSLLRNICSRIRPPKEAFNHIKHYSSDDQFRAIAGSLSDEKQAFHTYLYGQPFPRNESKLWSTPLYSTGKFHIEVRWVAQALWRYSSEINKLITQYEELDNQIILGKYEVAVLLLGEIEEKYGVSLCGIEKRLLLLELQKGFEANAKELSRLQSGENDPLVAILCTYLSSRAERAVSPDTYRSILVRDLQQFKDGKFLYEYLICRLSFLLFEEPDELRGVLNLENPLSIFDRYTNFLRVVRLAATRDTELAKELLPIVRNLANKISDPALNNLLAFLEPDADPKGDSLCQSMLVAYDLYYSGQYEACCKLCGDLLGVHPAIFQLHLLYVESLAFLGEEAPVEDGAQTIFQIVRQGINRIVRFPNNSQLGETLFKVSLIFGDRPISLSLMNFLASHQVIPFPDAPIDRIDQLAAPFANPKICFNFRDNERGRTFLRSFSGLSNGPYLQLLTEVVASENSNAIPDFPPCIAKEHSLMWRLRRAIELREFKRALAFADELNLHLSKKGAGLRLLQDEIITLRIQAFVGIGEVQNAINACIDALLFDPVFSRKAPFDTIFNAIKTHEVQSDFRISLLCSLAEREHRAIYIAYDHWMCSIGATRPTGLLEDSNLTGESIFLAFLSKVCIQKVLCRSHHFRSTDELEKERLKICQFLLERDPVNARLYTDEIQDITERGMIRRGVRQIDESKIYVDELGIRSRGKKLFSEMFTRFQAFAVLGASSPEVRLADSATLLSYFETDDAGQLVQKPIAERKSDKPIAILHASHLSHFKSLFLEIRDRFLSSGEHGLDAYLSTRVRHGTLEGYVRSTFERLNLIAQRDVVANEYLPVEYWKSRVGSDVGMELKLNSLISNFSRKIDGVVEKLKKEVVQLRTENKGDVGWFDFSFHEIELISLLTERFSEVQGYDEFMNEVFRVLWARTNVVLERVRNDIRTKIKDEVFDALIVLQQEIRAIVPAEAASELHANLTRGLTAVQNDFEKLANWFTISHSTLLPEFSMADVASICTASINNIYPSRQIKPAIAVSDNRVYNGKFFTPFSDIFRTLLDNVILRSGVSAEETKPEIFISESDRMLKIQVSNLVSDEILQSDPIEKMRAILDRSLDDFQRSGLVVKEGGTGLAKVKKIIQTDLGRSDSTMEFFYKETNRLVITIDMEVDGLLKISQ